MTFYLTVLQDVPTIIITKDVEQATWDGRLRKSDAGHFQHYLLVRV